MKCVVAQTLTHRRDKGKGHLHDPTRGSSKSWLWTWGDPRGPRRVGVGQREEKRDDAPLTPTVIGTPVFACTFGGALVGLWAPCRPLPDHHLSNDPKGETRKGRDRSDRHDDRAGAEGLVTASAKSSFDALNTAGQTHGRRRARLWTGLLARYGPVGE